MLLYERSWRAKRDGGFLHGLFIKNPPPLCGPPPSNEGGQSALLCKNFYMCGDTNCQTHDCCGGHGNYKCHCHEREEFDYNGYRDGDIVGEADFQIVDKYELEDMKSNGTVGGNLGDDLVNLGFIEVDSPLYKEMKNEGREGMFYEE